ncbi:MAG TPA: hypothetical protein VGI64_17810 [Streptosporangiaceae bacterium]|jgi:hypothetical protein
MQLPLTTARRRWDNLIADYGDMPQVRDWIITQAAEWQASHAATAAALRTDSGFAGPPPGRMAGDEALDCAEHGFTYTPGAIGCPVCILGDDPHVPPRRLAAVPDDGQQHD